MQNLNSKSANLADRSYKFSLEIILLAPLISSVPGFRPLSDQLFRSGTSIGANIAEAKSASSRIEFKKFQEIALKSANETTYWLNLAKDSGKFKQQEIQ
jgi:four helix bundle protein